VNQDLNKDWKAISTN